MRSVLFMSLMNGAPWGGSEELWYQSAFWLLERNYKVGVCCFDWPEKKNKLDKLKQAGCSLYLFPGSQQNKSIFYKLELKKVVWSVPYARYDRIVITQGGWQDAVHSPFKKLYKILPPYALTYYTYHSGKILNFHRKKSLTNWANSSIANLSDSERTFRAIRESNSIDIQRQHIIINPTSFRPPDSFTEFFSSDETKVFSMFAELDTSRKAQDLLIKALAHPEWKQRKWILNLFGRGNDRAFLENLVASLGMQTKVFLRGFTGDVKKMLAESHLILQMTHRDGLPLVVMESMAVSRPLVVSDVGDMPIWVREGVNGWVTQEVTEECIRNTLETAWKNQDRWEEMGKNSFTIFKQRSPADPIKQFLVQAGVLDNEI